MAKKPKYDVLQKKLGDTFLASPRVMGEFDEVRIFSRSPLFSENLEFIGTPGYHDESKIYYAGPPVAIATEIKVLPVLLNDFGWESEADKTNYIGVLLTCLTMPLWVMSGHPLIIINGNKVGTGKTTLAEIIQAIIEGRSPTSISYNRNDEEFEKAIASMIAAGDSSVIIDNARGERIKELSSSVLERSITAPVLNFRKLGSNTTISRPNNVTFMITMNFAKLNPDLRRRSIPINLWVEEDITKKKFPIPDILKFAMENRYVLISELALMVESWKNAGRPIPSSSACHSVNQVWAETIDGILTSNGFGGFLSNFDSSQEELDADFSIMENICEKHHDSPPLKALEWAETAYEELESKLTYNGKEKKKQAKATITGNMFSTYLGKTFTVHGEGEFVLRAERDGKGKKYYFERISDKPASLVEP